MSSPLETSEAPRPGSSGERASAPESGRLVVTVEVSDIEAYGKETDARLDSMAKRAPVLFESKVKLPKLGPDGERVAD